MGRGSGDGLVDHHLWHGRVEELAAQVLQQPHPLGDHGQATPTPAGPVQLDQEERAELRATLLALCLQGRQS
jgi:hypothetical protein